MITTIILTIMFYFQGLIVKSKRWSLIMENIEEKGKSKSIHGINMRILRAGN
jgi:hypothetical protein